MWNRKKGGNVQSDSKRSCAEPNRCTHSISKELWLFKNEIKSIFFFNLDVLFFKKWFLSSQDINT